MGHIEYIERLVKDMEKDFEMDGYINEKVEDFRRGVIFGMNYVIQSLKNPIDFEEGEEE